MNNLVPTSQAGFADLELAPYRSEGSQPTALERIMAGVYRQRVLGSLVFIAVVVIGAILTFNAPREYTAEASVLLEQQAPRVLADPDLDPQPFAQDSDRFLQTQLDHVQSRTLAEVVATELQMEDDPEYLTALGIDPGSGNQRDRVVTKLQQNVIAELGVNTRLATISFTSLDPMVSARVADAFAEALAAANLNSKLRTSKRAKRYLQNQLAKAKRRLEASEREMLAYARSADLTTITPSVGDKDAGGSLRAAQLEQMTTSLSQATARRVDAEQRWLQVSGAPALSLPEVQNNDVIQGLQAQKVELQAALEAERQRHTDDYPSAREAAAKIRELDARIAGLAANVKASLHGQFVAASKQERELGQVVDRLRGAAMAERERSVVYNSHQREVETNRAFYEGLLQRYKEVAAASGAPAANVTIVDRALPPRNPSSPNVPRNMALASMVALVLALLLGSVRDSMHNVVRSSEDLEQHLDLPTLGVVPTVRAGRPIEHALADARSAQSEAYHSIAVALEEATGVLPKTLLVTSSTASEGKSTSAVGLARSLTAMGKRVLVIDGDLRHPSLRRIIGGENGPGLSDVLTGAAALQKVVRRHDDHGFSVVSAGEAGGSPVSLLAARHIDYMLEQLSLDYDIVIIDGPPVMGLADAILLARRVAAILVIVESNHVRVSQLALALSRLPAANVVGAVLTKFNSKTAGVRYGGAEYYAY